MIKHPFHVYLVIVNGLNFMLPIINSQCDPEQLEFLSIVLLS